MPVASSVACVASSLAQDAGQPDEGVGYQHLGVYALEAVDAVRPAVDQDGDAMEAKGRSRAVNADLQPARRGPAIGRQQHPVEGAEQVRGPVRAGVGKPLLLHGCLDLAGVERGLQRPPVARRHGIGVPVIHRVEDGDLHRAGVGLALDRQQGDLARGDDHAGGRDAQGHRQGGRAARHARGGDDDLAAVVSRPQRVHIHRNLDDVVGEAAVLVGAQPVAAVAGADADLV